MSAQQYAPETLDRVYAALEHEADMDGVVTATGERIGELAGIARASASRVIHLLVAAGRITIVGPMAVRGGVIEVRIGDPS